MIRELKNSRTGVLLAGLLALCVCGCYTVPETGRRTLSLIPDSQMNLLGLQSFSELKTQERISQDPVMNEAVQRVGTRIAAAVGDRIPNAKWEFVLFENDEMINAFAMPGGKVGFYTGMFRVADTDDALAIVMGHEIAHVAARHGTERLSQALVVEALGRSLSAALEKEEDETRRIAMAAFGLGTSIGYSLPFSRLLEREADEIGLLYAARAGYDPRTAIRFWERMEEAEASGQVPFLSTYPSAGKRIQKLKALMPDALKEYERSKSAP